MNKLWVRLSLAFGGVVLVAMLMIVTTGFLLEQSDDDRGQFLARFLQQPNGLVDRLAEFYQEQQGWAGVEPLLVGAQAANFKTEQIFVLADNQGTIIYHPRPEVAGSPLSRLNPVFILPVQAQNQTVGFLGVVARSEQYSGGAAYSFTRILRDTLLTVAGVGGIGGIVFGVLMSRSLTAPLNRLAEAARAIGARNLSRRVEEKGSDEIIKVAHAFNEMAADLEQAEQLRRNLLADVAHELRTPLSVLQGNLRAILDEVYPMNKVEIARLYEHTRLLSRMISDLHELAQAEAKQLPLNLQDTDPAPLVQTTVDTFRPNAEAKGVRLQMYLAGDVPPIAVDPARLRQVLQNLLANALRHTPAGGQISVAVEPNSNNVHLIIADTGEGIPPEHLPHIFDRFYRTDPARSRDRGGAGLGLAIARAIIEAHGGQISVTSPGVAGQGSRFLIRLPLNGRLE